MHTGFAELVPHLGIVGKQPRGRFERREETVTLLPPGRHRRILIQGLEQRFGSHQQALSGWQSVVQPARPQQVHTRQRVAGEGAPLRDLSQSSPAETEGTVQLDGPLVVGQCGVRTRLSVKLLALQKGLECREGARTQGCPPHRGERPGTGQVSQETNRQGIDEPIHPGRRASQLRLSQRCPRARVEQRGRQVHRVRTAGDEGSEYGQPGPAAPRDLGRGSAIRMSAPLADHDGRRHGAQCPCAVQFTREQIDHPLPPERELGIEHLERRDGDEVRVKRRAGARAPARHGQYDRPDRRCDGTRHEHAARRAARPSWRGTRWRQRLPELCRRGKPIRRRLRQRLADRERDRFWHTAPQRADMRNRLTVPLRDNGLGARTRVRRFAREHFVKHAAEAIDVAPSVQLPVCGRLLRTHVRWGPYGHAGLGQLRVTGCS